MCSLAPLGINVSASLGGQIEATIAQPNLTTGITLYQVFVHLNETERGGCNITELTPPIECTIRGLELERNYSISAFSCIAFNSTIIRSSETRSTFYLPGKIFFEICALCINSFLKNRNKRASVMACLLVFYGHCIFTGQCSPKKIICFGLSFMGIPSTHTEW